MKKNLIYRGVSKEVLYSYKKKGIPSGTLFTTDPFMAQKHGKKLIAVCHSKSGFNPSADNFTFKLLKIKEKYFVNKKLRKKFIEVGCLR
jgi:hypothetical protein